MIFYAKHRWGFFCVVYFCIALLCVVLCCVVYWIKRVGRYMYAFCRYTPKHKHEYVLHIVSVIYLTLGTLPYLTLLIAKVQQKNRIECLGTVRVRVRVR